MKILVTGAAGFIGTALVKKLLEDRSNEVTGLDNLNNYYSSQLKMARLDSIDSNERFHFIRGDITDSNLIEKLFAQSGFEIVVNLAAQAGVRYSIENPRAYIQSNVVGFLNILEGCRKYPVKHLIYASSSSVYGEGNRVPYKENDMTDFPVSLYAATKKSDELMAHAYSHLFNIPATGLRFFTVYGPWGRPDMAPFIFMDAVIKGNPIRVFNHGNMRRDFTYIDDVVDGICRVIHGQPSGHEVFNIGHSEPVELMEFINVIEKVSGKKARLIMEEMQPGDVTVTYADTSKLQCNYGFKPQIGVTEGITNFYEWYKEFYK